MTDFDVRLGGFDVLCGRRVLDTAQE
jgi:hypothetical protein